MNLKDEIDKTIRFNINASLIHNDRIDDLTNALTALIERICLTVIMPDEEYTEQRNLSNEVVDNMRVSIRNSLKAEQRNKLAGLLEGTK